MEPLEIRIALMRAGVKSIEIAREAKVDPSTVYRVIDRLSTSDRIQRKIAKAINQPVEAVFPDRYKKPGKADSYLGQDPDQVAV